MAASLGMTDAEVQLVAAYVRKLGRSAPQSVPGDASKGAVLYKTNCSGCHMVKGSGGRMGPDLTDIGLRRSPSNLRTSITDPDASLAAGWTSASVTTKDGKKFNGVRMQEDTFQITIRSGSQIRTFDKAEVASVQRGLTKSTMPSFKKLSDADLDSLVAHLFSLRGEQ